MKATMKRIRAQLMDHTLYLYQINMKNLSLVIEIKMIPKAELLKDNERRERKLKELTSQQC